MQYGTASARLSAYRKQIAELRRKMQKLQGSAKPEPVDDYGFATAKGPVRLSQLFGKKDHLFVIHNMGAGDWQPQYKHR